MNQHTHGDTLLSQGPSTEPGSRQSAPVPLSGLVVWLTGLSGAGKSTLADALADELTGKGFPVRVLDGDAIRATLNRDLGYSQADRDENIRRVAEIALLFADTGFIVVVAAISPLRRQRQQARRRIGHERFVEVHVCTPLEICELRDPKGLYRKARSGLISGFTGVDSPYEEPTSPELRIDGSGDGTQAGVDSLIARIRVRRPRCMKIAMTSRARLRSSSS